MQIKNKNALVTGAANGIGRATALMLAENGAAKIVIVDIDRSALDVVAAEISDLGAKAITKVVDLSRPEAVVTLFEEANVETGGLDIVHNNAGIMSGEPFFPDSSVERMVKVIELNLMAVIVGTRIAVEHMRKKSTQGVIINTSSIAAFGPMPADPAYSTSKAAVINFTQSCASLHEDYGIRVMAVCPAITDTAIVPKDALWLQDALNTVIILTPAEIAGAVLDIIEDDSLSGEYVIVENKPAG